MSSLDHYLFTRIPRAHEDMGAAEVLRRLRAPQDGWDSINYIYVEDRAGRLSGVFSIKELLMADPRARVGSFMHHQPVTISEHTSPRRAVAIAIEHGLKAVPVVDGAGALVGVVASDAMHQILHKTHVEDFLRSAGFTRPGVHFIDVLRVRFFVLLRARFVWLLVGLCGGIAAAWITNAFDALLETELLLAFFVPLVLYLSAAVGAQTGTLFIRTLAVQRVHIWPYLWRELASGCALGFFFGILGAVFVITLWGHRAVAIILGLTLCASIVASSVIAVLIPWVLYLSKRDPATGSGPFATIIQDILSLTIYFLIATLIL